MPDVLGTTKNTALPNLCLHCPPRAGLPEKLAAFCRIKAHTIHCLLALPLLHAALHRLLKLVGYFSVFTSAKKNTIYFVCSLLKQFFQLNLSHQDKGCLTGWLPTRPSGQGFLPCSVNWWQGWHPVQLLGRVEGGWQSAINIPFPIIIMGCVTECNHLSCKFQNNLKSVLSVTAMTM